MKKGRKGNDSKPASRALVRIQVEQAAKVEWEIPVLCCVVPATRKIPGSLVTNIFCAKGPEQAVQLRLTRFVHAPAERQGFLVN